MTRTTRHTITALLALAGVVSFVGVSAAVEGEEPVVEEVETPCLEDTCDEPADDGTDAETDGTVDDGTVDDGTDGTTDEEVLEVEEPETGPVDNHGAAVSTAAHECPPGPEHGPCVREVAQSDAGKPVVDSTEEDDELDASDAPATKGGRPEGKGKPAR